MKKQEHTQNERDIFNSLLNVTKMLAGLVVLLIGGAIFLAYQLTADNSESTAAEPHTEQTVAVKTDTQPAPETAAPAEPQIEDGKDVQTGLLAADGLQIVKSTCTACHSSDLILQNRFTREGWHEKIVWMQETQGLWDLGDNESTILDYLADNYSPAPFKGRRQPLTNIDWYQLKD